MATLGEESRQIFISANLLSEMKQILLGQLQEFKDVFVWTHGNMAGLNLQLLNITKDASQQSKRRETSRT